MAGGFRVFAFDEFGPLAIQAQAGAGRTPRSVAPSPPSEIGTRWRTQH